LNTKDYILKKVCNQTVDGPAIPTMGVNGCLGLYDYPYSSKYLLLCSEEESNSYRFGTTWKWEI